MDTSSEETLLRTDTSSAIRFLRAALPKALAKRSSLWLPAATLPLGVSFVDFQNDPRQFSLPVASESGNATRLYYLEHELVPLVSAH